MNKMKPTARQLEILEFILWRCDGGLPPSFHEMKTRFGINSTNAIRDHLNRLTAHGFILREVKLARAIRVTEKGREAVKQYRLAQAPQGEAVDLPF